MNDSRFKTSELWSDYRKTVSRKLGGRGYGINTSVSLVRIKNYLNVRNLFEFPSRIFTKLTNISDKVLKRFEVFLSFVILGSSDNHIKFCLDYGLKNYDPKLLEDFSNFTENKILYSHNSLKSFDYLTRLDMEIGLVEQFENKTLNVFEIGAGVFNFGALLSLKVRKLNYVICDLPEMIEASKASIEDLNLIGMDIEYFNSHQVEEYLLSDKNKKVIFFEPDEIDSIDKLSINFDLFVNHESFSEMNIDIVNNYLIYVQQYLAKEGIVFLVNRHSRIQLLDLSKLRDVNQITSFSDYKLDFCEAILITIDQFRNRIPAFRLTPNVVYIGKSK